MLTIEALEREVRRLAEANPDAEYRAYVPEGEDFASCWYTTGTAGGQVGCLIGQAIRNLDKEMYDRIAGYEEEKRRSVEICMMRDVFVGFPEVSNWLREVQYHQDSGLSWSQCLEEADRLEELYPSVV